MKSFPFLPLALGASLLTVLPLQADVNSDLAFSAFSNVDLQALAGGTVQQSRGGLINFQRGITSQSLYVVNAAPAVVQSKLIHWNQSSHSNLKVWLHQSLPQQWTTTDFAGLGSLPDNSSVKALRDATAKFDPSNPSLQLSKEEGQMLVTTLAAAGADPFVGVWSQILSGRISNFLNGRLGSETYVQSDGTIQPLSELKNLLHADPRIYGQYQHLLNQTPLKAGTVATTRLAPADLYYEVFDVQGEAAIGTGAIYQAASPATIQSADIEFYDSCGIYVTAELDQLWPVTIDGRNETLVWRADLVSAPNIAYLHGTERLASGMVMLEEVKDAIEAFRSECQ
ncbi:MAG: hypothetical protein LV479_00590 [Methylacidiphilales bacterium]|nr:hypothetical protein [Candidatus Methylacidiphilales bacterium]